MENSTYPINSITPIASNTVDKIGIFLPHLINALVIILVGLIVATIVRAIVFRILERLKIDSFLVRARLEDTPHPSASSRVLSEVVYWFIVASFLIPAFSVLGLSVTSTFIDQFSFYLPSFFSALVMGAIGMALGNIAFDIVKKLSKGEQSKILASLARTLVYLFTAFIALTELGVAIKTTKTFLLGFLIIMALAVIVAFGFKRREQLRSDESTLKQKTSKMNFNLKRANLTFMHEIKLPKRSSGRSPQSQS